jgi:hypothetical protein
MIPVSSQMLLATRQRVVLGVRGRQLSGKYRQMDQIGGSEYRRDMGGQALPNVTRFSCGRAGRTVGHHPH